MSVRLGRARMLLACAAAVALSACENSATAYSVEGTQHSLALVREQPYFWTSTVNQYIVASRLPDCQRRIAIHPDATMLTPMEVYPAADRLWALRQGERWYLVSTRECRVQDWRDPMPTSLGGRIGVFHLEDGKPVFTQG